MEGLKEYLKEIGDSFIIEVLTDEGQPYGYYAGSIRPYVKMFEQAKLYKSNSSALNTAKKQGILKFNIVALSSLI